MNFPKLNQFKGWRPLEPLEPMRKTDRLIAHGGEWLPPYSVPPGMPITSSRVGKTWEWLVGMDQINPEFYPYRELSKKYPDKLIPPHGMRPLDGDELPAKGDIWVYLDGNTAIPFSKQTPLDSHFSGTTATQIIAWIFRPSLLNAAVIKANVPMNAYHSEPAPLP
jgi:hypothetical protein